ncbi:hypothetical protein M8C21_010682 [Ambrosia artemisiifolia]|uniref:DCD domain-containing protein n=1 Tax=Ambrosia artemisiifolia TaxID=4212 RepID=A0AAD5D435_AMBAR|nr:hypothetical protein M8C21_010682 [Ambrosia artemisiifolia]
MGSHNGSSKFRGLWKSKLGGVIFSTNNERINESLRKNLFGQTIHGIFEAASAGQMNIDPCAWTCEGSQLTQYPAQVRVRVKLQCKVLTENQFKPIIIDNYHSLNHFWFELDHAQTYRLLSLLASQVLSCPRTTLTPHDTTNRTPLFPSVVEVVTGHLKNDKSLPVNIKQVNTSNTVTEKDIICMKLKELALKRKLLVPSPSGDENYVCPKLSGETPLSGMDVNNSTVEKKSPNDHPMAAKLVEKLEELMAFKATQKDAINHLEQRITFLEQNLVNAKAEITSLKDMSNTSVESCVCPQECDDVRLADEISLVDDPILLVGGFDGVSWLSSLDCYTPSQNLTKSLSPMNTERCYAAVSKLDGELFVFGGGTCGQWFDTVESYDPVADQWTTCPPLSKKNGSLAGATVNDKIYAIGGGNGVDCYSTVEMLDFDVGAWIPSRSMLEKRFALAAAELNGALYAVGGYDGKYYLRTAERFDPRERSWKKIESMSTIRGSPSMVVLNEKLYVLGGYDDKTMVSTVEIYDPRRGSWVVGEPMNHPRGFSAAAVVKDSIYVIGGLKSGDVINDTVECYKEGRGWEMTNTNDAYRRCFCSAIAL